MTDTATHPHARSAALGRLMRRPEAGTLLGTLVVYAFFAALGGTTFLGAPGWSSFLNMAAEIGIIALPVGLLMIAGELDISVGAVLPAASLTVAILSGHYDLPTWIGILGGLGVGLLIGLVNGLLVVKVRMNAFIVTLASFIWVRGLVVAVSGGRSAQNLADELRWFAIQRIFGIPVSAYIAILCFVAFSVMMSKTRYGRHLTMIGGNEVAAFRAGIKVQKLVIIAFVLSGAIAALAGWLLAIRTSGATANLGTGMLFNAFAAVVISGVSLKGGIGILPGVYAGVLLLSSINTAITLMHLPPEYTQVIHGLLVLAAVLLDTLKQTIRQKLN